MVPVQSNLDNLEKDLHSLLFTYTHPDGEKYFNLFTHLSLFVWPTFCLELYFRLILIHTSFATYFTQSMSGQISPGQGRVVVSAADCWSRGWWFEPDPGHRWSTEVDVVAALILGLSRAYVLLEKIAAKSRANGVPMDYTSLITSKSFGSCQ